MVFKAVPPEQRFWSRVETVESGCWLWTGHVANTGYGIIHIDRKPYGAHRFAYQLLVGPIEKGLQLDHLCLVRHCVNPAHLEPVTCRTNLQRGETLAAANSRKTHCLRGHEFTEVNTYLYRGRRLCRECRRTTWREAHPAKGLPPGASRKTACQNGHPFPESLYVSPKGKRECRVCRDARNAHRVYAPAFPESGFDSTSTPPT